MRLQKYLDLSESDKDINTFRMLNVKIYDGKTEYDKIVEKVTKQHKINEDILSDIDFLNKELRKVYKGKYMFQLCIDEGKYMLSDVKIFKLKDKFNKMVMEINDKFSNMKSNIEKKLSSN
jgi:hypothetical protein